MPDDKTKLTSADAIKRGDALVKKIAEDLKAAEQAKDDLEESKKDVAETRDSSIRAVSKQISAVNDPALFESTFEGDPFKDGKSKVWTVGQYIADATARLITGGTDQPAYQPRKSELNLMFSPVGVKHMADMINEYDAFAKSEKLQLNTRSKVLSGLRQIKKDSSLTPAGIVAKEKAKRNAKPNPAIEARKLVDKLMDCGAFSEKRGDRTIFDDRAIKALEVLRDIAGEPDIDGTLARAEERARAEATAAAPKMPELDEGAEEGAEELSEEVEKAAPPEVAEQDDDEALLAALENLDTWGEEDE